MNSKAKPADTSLIVAGLCGLVCLIVLIFVIPFSSGYSATMKTISSMLGDIWKAPENEDWQHGMLVPFIVAGIIYWKRQEIFVDKPKPANFGLAVILLALLLFCFGALADVTMLGYVVIHLFIVGMVIWFLGWGYFRRLLFPLIFLGFTWPFLFLTEYIAVPLRHMMAAISARALNLVGIETVLIGTGLRSAPDPEKNLLLGQLFSLDVADPCSGIRSLFALMMVSALFGYLTLPKTWQRVTLFLAGIPLAVFGNFIRMMLLTFGTIWFGASFAIGTYENPSGYHMAAGYAVFIAAIMGMLGVSWILQRNWGGLLQKIAKKEERPATPGGSTRGADHSDEY